VRSYRFGSPVIAGRRGPKRFRKAEEEFSGEGGILASGRWHIKGEAVVYAATSEPLALLEKLVHRSVVSRGLVYPLYLADVPDDLVEELPASALPPDWRSIYPPTSTQELGHAWLASKSAIGLLVPSVLLSGAEADVKNCLVNPLHPEFKSTVRLSGPIEVPLDPRL
jgi:RES domain-containing protein